jgi:hypothetical protein
MSERTRLLVALGAAALTLVVASGWGATGDLDPHLAAPPPAVTSVAPLVGPELRTVPQSVPVQLHQPDTGLNLAVLELPSEARDPIDPPTAREAYWDPAPVVTDRPAQSYAPGTSTSDLTVIAGHTGTVTEEAAFNAFFDWREQTFRVEPGDEVWVRTQTSGELWLVYRLERIHTVPKGRAADSLVNSREIWGTDARPRPDRLLLIGCIQRTEGGPSTANFVLDLELVGTR